MPKSEDTSNFSIVRTFVVVDLDAARARHHAGVARGCGKFVAMWLWRKRSSAQDELPASSRPASTLSQRSSPATWVHRYLSQASTGFVQSLVGKRLRSGPDRATILAGRKRPACLGCGDELRLAHVFPIVPNYELRWFECATCGHPLSVVAACSDPIDLVEDRPQYAPRQPADRPAHPDA